MADRWGVSVALAVLTLLGNEVSAAAMARISGQLLSVLQRFEVILVGVAIPIAESGRRNLSASSHGD